MGERLKPIPEQENFTNAKDIHPVFGLIKGKSFEAFLQQDKMASDAIERAYRAVHTEHISNIWHDADVSGLTDERVIEFLGHMPNEKEHWHGLFGMMKAAGFNVKEEVRAGAYAAINKMTNGTLALTKEEILAYRKIADEALADVYDSETSDNQPSGGTRR
jgi:hypothetical protein